MNLTAEELQKLDKQQLIEGILIQQKTIRTLENRIARLEKDSNTSSKPPSGDYNKPKRNQSLRPKSDRKSGGQKGHEGYTRSQIGNPDKKIMCMPESECEKCGGKLNIEDAVLKDKRQEVEIPKIKPTVTEYQRMITQCKCGHCNVGKFPNHIKGPVQIGSKMKSFLIYLNTVQLIPYKRLTELSEDLFNFRICKRTIENALEEGAEKGQAIYKSILNIVKNGKWVGSDETGTKVNGEKWWEWVWQSKDANYYAIDKSRGYQVVKKHFGEDYDGTLCHDCWSAHNNTVAKSGHQQCHPHIQRELKFLIETYNSRWAYDLNHFLLKVQKARDKIWAEDFKEEYRDRIILAYKKKLSKFLVKDSSKKDILRLQKRICKHHHEILHFLHDPDVPFHNNDSERAIRKFKVKHKISGGFRSQRGADRYSILLSIIETSKKQKMNLLSSIQSLLHGSLAFGMT